MKPAYNSVDMIDVELVDDDREARDYDPLLVEVSKINRFTLVIREKKISRKSHFLVRNC